MKKHSIYGSALVFTTLIIVIVYFGYYRITNSNEYKETIKYISSNLIVKSQIGDVREIEFIEGGKTNNAENTNEYYYFEFDVIGETGQINVISWVTKSDDCKGYLIKTDIKHKANGTIEIDTACFS